MQHPRAHTLNIHNWSTIEPLPKCALWFTLPDGDDGLDNHFQHLHKPGQVSDIRRGVSSPIPLSTFDTDSIANKTPLKISEGDGTAVKEELCSDSNPVVPFEPYLNPWRKHGYEFAPPSTLFPWETQFTQRFPVFPDLLGDGPSGELNKEKPTVDSDIVAKNSRVTDTCSAGPVSFNCDNSNGNASSYSGNFDNHLLPASEQRASPELFSYGYNFIWDRTNMKDRWPQAMAGPKKRGIKIPFPINQFHSIIRILPRS